MEEKTVTGEEEKKKVKVFKKFKQVEKNLVGSDTFREWKENMKKGLDNVTDAVTAFDQNSAVNKKDMTIKSVGNSLTALAKNEVFGALKTTYDEANKAHGVKNKNGDSYAIAENTDALTDHITEISELVKNLRDKENAFYVSHKGEDLETGLIGESDAFKDLMSAGKKLLDRCDKLKPKATFFNGKTLLKAAITDLLTVMGELENLKFYKDADEYKKANEDQTENEGENKKDEKKKNENKK